MSEGGSKRAVAEIRFGEERTGITKVGGRSIHQFWSLLSPHFRDVLLAPQRRSDDGGVAWTWREPLEKRAISAADLAGVRKRLERANESFAENPVNPLLGEDRGGTSSQVLIDQVAAKVKTLAESLSAKSDAALAEFVCRTETGVMVHSWGVASAAQVVYPESLETGISGVVLTGGKPLEGYEVVVENMQGLSVARTRSDSAGVFNFSKIGQGRYRVRVVSGRVKFPAKGNLVTVERGAVAQLELRSTADSDAQGDSKEEAAKDAVAGGLPGSGETNPPQTNGGRKWIGRGIGVLVLLALIAGGGVWIWRTWMGGANPDERVAVRRSTMAPEDFSTGTIDSEVSRHVSGDSGGLGVSADGSGRTSRPSISSAGHPGDARQSTAETGRAAMPSSIGSKVEVQSGVGASTSATVANVGGLGDESAANNETVTEEPAVVEPNSARTGGAEPAKPVVRKPKLSTGSRPAGEAQKSNAGGLQAPGLAGGAIDERDPLAGSTRSESAVSLAKNKKKGSVSALGALPSNPSGGDATPLDRINAPGDAPLPEEDLDGTNSGKPPVISSSEKSPVSKVVVVNKGPAPGKTESGEQTESGESDAAAVAKSDVVAKPGSKKPVAKKSKAGAGVSAGDRSKAENDSPNDDLGNDASSPQQALSGKSDPAGGLPISSSGNGESKTTRDAGSGTNTVEASNSSSRGGFPAKRAPTQRQTVRPTRSTTTTGAQSAQEPPEAEPSAEIDPAVAGTAGTKSANYEIDAIRWTVRLVRDAIVPTLPVKVGDVDSTASVRERMLTERRALAPTTIQRHATRLSFVFVLPETLAGNAPFWRDENDMVKRTVDGRSAEIGWTDETVGRPGVSVLLASDGKELVRLSLNEKGGFAMTLAEGVRASLNLGVTRVVSDEKATGAGRPGSRFFWEVNGVARKAQDLKPDDKYLGISFPLENAKALRIEVALADRISGWALVSKISIRDGGPGGRLSRESQAGADGF